jgi:endonuclease/exonuclease/phosphatase family metal-dependent hydrolase
MKQTEHSSMSSGTHAAHSSSSSKSSKSSGNALKVLTYNLFIRPPGINARGNDYKDERLAEFIKVIDSYDVICLQELFGAFSSRQHKFLDAAKERGFTHSVVSPHVGWFSGFLVDGGLCLISKHRIVAQHTLTYPKGTASDQLAAKGVLHALLEVASDDASAGTQHVHVFCTHLQSSYYPAKGLFSEGFLKSNAIRVAQLGALKAFIETCLADDSHDALLVGDFNVNARQHTHGSDEHELVDAQFGGFHGAARVEVADDHEFHVSAHYHELLDALASPAYTIFDTLRDAAESIGLHAHPVTIGDVVMHGEKIEPREILLTDEHDLRCRQCLDYVFLLQRANAQDGTHVDVDAELHPHTYVERFAIESEGVTSSQLSDHYGVVSNVLLAARAARRHHRKRRELRRSSSRRSSKADSPAASSSTKEKASRSKTPNE